MRPQSGPMPATRRRTTTPHRFVLAGASGLVGRALARQLAADPECQALNLLLRRPTPALEALPHARAIAWGGDDLPPLPEVDAALCALGTTLRSAGSQAAFRAVDFDAVLAYARAAQAAGARRFGVVSALGADARSPVFYNRIKGEMEQALAALGFAVLVIARPSLLLGDRSALGQPARLGEQLAQAAAPWLTWMTPRRLRPIKADTVARGMLVALAQARPGLRVVESDELHSLAEAG
ncbi:MAG: NAD(P)H-binding protein [Burkholderiales bacterium]|nr:NAD(P)H-binding protein [Burkholderiales bacterium]